MRADRANTLGAFTRPTTFSSATTGFYGPGFSIADATVPEPSVLALGGGYVVLNLLGYARRRRRSREMR